MAQQEKRKWVSVTVQENRNSGEIRETKFQIYDTEIEGFWKRVKKLGEIFGKVSK